MLIIQSCRTLFSSFALSIHMVLCSPGGSFKVKATAAAVDNSWMTAACAHLARTVTMDWQIDEKLWLGLYWMNLSDANGLVSLIVPVSCYLSSVFELADGFHSFRSLCCCNSQGDHNTCDTTYLLRKKHLKVCVAWLNPFDQCAMYRLCTLLSTRQMQHLFLYILHCEYSVCTIDHFSDFNAWHIHKKILTLRIHVWSRNMGSIAFPFLSNMYCTLHPIH